jgi:alkylated DNA nucleotide flippase Atl1
VSDGEWEPTRWWRVVDAAGELMAESSDEAECRAFAAETPGAKVHRLYRRVQTEDWWRTDV